jgi:ribosomal protein S18 acetylase RimI-like enzyme
MTTNVPDHITFDYIPKIGTPEYRTIRQKILAFNAPHIGGEQKPFSFYIRRERVLRGGIVCWESIDHAFIDILWVDEECRHLGFGGMLLAKAEAEAKKRGLDYMVLDTFDFQAEGFYLKHGYENIGTLKNFIRGHDRFYMKKMLK